MQIIEEMRSKARYLNGTLSLLDANLATDITHWADVLATDYTALEAERDEWKRRCEKICNWIDNNNDNGDGEAIYAIAEGRES